MQWKLSEKKRVPLNWKKSDGSAGSASDVTASSSDETVATVEVKDGFVYVTNVAPGKATITASGDTDPGDGVKPISKSFDLEILSDDTAAELDFGAPEDQPA